MASKTAFLKRFILPIGRGAGSACPGLKDSGGSILPNTSSGQVGGCSCLSVFPGCTDHADARWRHSVQFLQEDGPHHPRGSGSRRRPAPRRHCGPWLARLSRSIAACRTSRCPNPAGNSPAHWRRVVARADGITEHAVGNTAKCISSAEALLGWVKGPGESAHQ
jgi:hypothetical protein